MGLKGERRNSIRLSVKGLMRTGRCSQRLREPDLRLQVKGHVLRWQVAGI